MAIENKTAGAKTVDEYIKRFPPKTQIVLRKVRQAIRAAAPMADEVISYSIAGYKYHGMLLFFAGWKDHVSLYPAPWDVAALKKEMSAYKGSKGTIKFPLNEPLPIGLITRIVKARIKKNEDAFAAKNKKAANPAVTKTKSAKPTDAEQVEEYMKNLKTRKAETEAVRAIIRNSNKKLSERIKWNAPSYYYKEDIVTFGPYRNDKILLVFHHPAIVKIKSALLEGNYTNRRLACFDSMKTINDNKKELTRIMNELVKAIDLPTSKTGKKQRH